MGMSYIGMCWGAGIEVGADVERAFGFIDGRIWTSLLVPTHGQALEIPGKDFYKL